MLAFRTSDTAHSGLSISLTSGAWVAIFSAIELLEAQEARMSSKAALGAAAVSLLVSPMATGYVMTWYWDVSNPPSYFGGMSGNGTRQSPSPSVNCATNMHYTNGAIMDNYATGTNKTVVASSYCGDPTHSKTSSERYLTYSHGRILGKDLCRNNTANAVNVRCAWVDTIG